MLNFKKYLMILEYNKADTFLSSYDSAEEYALDNISDVADAFDAHKKDPSNIHAEYSRDSYVDRIDMYVDRYKELKNKKEVIIYRMVALDDISELNIEEIGKHWSFEKSGVGVYGEQHPNRDKMKAKNKYTLTGTVNPKFIDWIYGFNSFIWYGEDQWECALLYGAEVTITKINGEKLETPIKSKVGRY